MTDERQQTDQAWGWDPRVGEWVEPKVDADELVTVESRPPRPDRTWLRAGIAGGVIGALLASLVIIPLSRSGQSGSAVVERRLAEGIPSTRQGATSVVAIAERARPWVVNVNVTGQQFGAQFQSLGSGVILRSDGHIITNAHVVQGAQAVDVVLPSGERLDAEVVGADTDTDIAVIKVDRDGLPAAVIGSAEDLKVGEVAVAIGSPLGLEQSVTSGIISALGRDVDRTGQPPLVEMIQTDAAVTEGNSGGALVNGEGAVIGINTLIAASPQVGAEGIAFAIPIDIAVDVAEELITSGRATHPWIGISGGNITPEISERYDIERGALINEVIAGGPADKAGVRKDDIVVSFDGERIDSMSELVVAIRSRKVGDTVEFVVVRAGKRITLQAKLEDKPSDL